MTAPNHDVDYPGRATLAALESADNYNAAIQSLFGSLPGVRGEVLDVGAGSGEFSRRLRALGATVTCVEPDPRLRARLEAEGFRCHAAIESAPDSFDLITMVNVLEHIEDDRAALASLRSKLAADGQLFVFVPALQILYSRFDLAIGHHRRYGHRTLQHLVADSGLTVERLRWFDSLGIPTALVFRLTRKASPAARAVRLYDRVIFPISRQADRIAQFVCGKNLYCIARNSGGAERGLRSSIPRPGDEVERRYHPLRVQTDS